MTSTRQPPTNLDSPDSPSRRRFLAKALAVSVVSVLPVRSLATDRYDIHTTYHDVPVRGLPRSLEGLRVVQLSDLHRSRLNSEEFIREAVEAAERLQPDLALVTGDFISTDFTNIYSCADALESLSATMGVYGVLGNHDHALAGPAVAAHLTSRGIRILNNEATDLGGLWLGGVDDLWLGQPDLPRTMKAMPPDAPRLLLCHNPRVLPQLKGENIIVFSGHTHGGQIYLGPLTGIIVPECTDNGRYISGWYSSGNTRMYVNRGIGVVGIPARMFCPPEITLFTLRSA